jgi:hypothetical protein
VLGALAIALALAAAPSEEPIAVGVRPPLLVVITRTAQVVSKGEQTPVFEAARRALRETTRLEAMSPEEAQRTVASFERCRQLGSFSCWADAAASGPEPPPRLLLIFASHPAGRGPDLVQATLIDVPRAIELESSSQSNERKEDRIFAQAVKTVPGSVRIDDRAELLLYFKGLFGRELADWLRPYPPFAALGIRGTTPGTSIELDGQVVGVAKLGEVSIEGLEPGSHHLRLLEGSRAIGEGEVELSSNARVVFDNITPSRVDLGERSGGPFWGLGAASGAAGAILIAIALASHGGVVEVAPCLPSRCNVPSQFLSSDQLGPHSGLAGASGGVLVAPLGYSLLLSGATLALAPLVDRSAALPDWLWFAIAAGAGGLAYGLSAALNPR